MTGGGLGDQLDDSLPEWSAGFGRVQQLVSADQVGTDLRMIAGAVRGTRDEIAEFGRGALAQEAERRRLVERRCRILIVALACVAVLSLAVALRELETARVGRRRASSGFKGLLVSDDRSFWESVSGRLFLAGEGRWWLGDSGRAELRFGSRFGS